MSEFVAEKLKSELKILVDGRVSFDGAVLEEYSRDRSLFEVRPWAVVSPKNVEDVKVLIKWLAEKCSANPDDLRLSITSRGGGFSFTGGPLNQGIILKFSKPLDKILEIGTDFVRVEPAATLNSIAEALSPHNRFLPFISPENGFMSAGGAVAQNIGGMRSVKYGSIRYYIKHLKLVEANGSEVVITAMDFADLSLKKQQINLDGDIYRNIEALLQKNKQILEQNQPKVSKFASGYNLWDIDRLTDSGRFFDLSQLIAGSEGTLGIITEIAFWTLPAPIYFSAMLFSMEDLNTQVIKKIAELEPSVMEFTSKPSLELTGGGDLEAIKNSLSGKIFNWIVYLEFDGENQEEVNEKIELSRNILTGAAVKSIADKNERRILFDLFARLPEKLATRVKENKKAAPFIEDAVLPLDNLPSFVVGALDILNKAGIEFGLCGHAGEGSIHIWPLVDIKDSGIKDSIFSIAEKVNRLCVSLGGAMSGEHGDGLLRTKFVPQFFDPRLYKLFEETKKIFDPLNIFNPGKKVAISGFNPEVYLGK